MILDQKNGKQQKLFPNPELSSFSCHVYLKHNDKLIKSLNTSCWGMLAYPTNSWDFIKVNNFKLFNEKNIYISNFDKDTTRQYQDVLISTINEITPCQKVTIDNVEYIEIKLLKTYDQSLIILNFIRNLWFEPPISVGYSIDFFEELKKSKKEDPLEKLMEANKKACANYKGVYGYGHCNVHPYNQLKIKKTSELLMFNGMSTWSFLTN